MISIATNVLSQTAQGHQRKAQSSLATALERLSSGLRINSAKDDAAGQAIANRLSAQITGGAVAQRNANDGISLSRTAHQVLSEVNDRLQRIRELTVQGLTGTLTQRDRDFVQAEINFNLMEIDRLNEQANYNGLPLLSGQAGMVNLQVGANAGEALGIDLRPPGFSVEALGLKEFNISGIPGTVRLTSQVPGDSSDIHLYPTDGTGTTMNFWLEGGAMPTATTTLMKRDDGGYYVQSIEDGRPVHYQASMTAMSETGSRSSLVTVTADPSSRLGEPTELTTSLTGATYLDAEGAPLTSTPTPRVVQGSDDAYYVQVHQGGEKLFYPATVSTDRERDSTGTSTSSVVVQASSSLPLTATSYQAAELPNWITLSEAAVSYQNFPEGGNPEDGKLVEVDGEIFLRTQDTKGAYTYHSVKLSVEALPLPGESGVSIRFVETIEAEESQGFDAKAAPIPEARELEVPELANDIELMVGSDRYYQRVSGESDTFQPVSLMRDGDVLTVQPLGVPRGEAAGLEPATPLSTFTLPLDDMSIDYQAEDIDGEVRLVRDEGGQYYLRAIEEDGGVAFYRANVTTETQADRSQAVTVTAGDLVRRIGVVETVNGSSSIELQAPMHDNVTVSYREASGRLHPDVLAQDADGNYIMNLSSGGGIKSATLVKMEDLEGYHVSTDGDYLLRTLNGTGEVVIYYALRFETTPSTDASHDNDYASVVLLAETGEEIRLRRPADPLAALDRAIGRVDEKRSHLGAMENRLGSVIDMQLTMEVNLSAARSRIMDADYAVEVSNMTRANILQQAGTSILAQANQTPQSVLSLLG